MGAGNVHLAYRGYAGRVPATPMQLLVYMALVCDDFCATGPPTFGEGYADLARHALGRPRGSNADLKAVERHMTALLASGAVTPVRRPAPAHARPRPAAYRLNLYGAAGPVPPPELGDCAICHAAVRTA